jgi:hypothetical protein
MGNYRTTQQPYAKNFGGINRNATVLNMKENEAESIVNMDIGDRGSVRIRSGIVAAPLISKNENQTDHINAFYDSNEDYRYYSYGKVYTDLDDLTSEVTIPGGGTVGTSGFQQISVGFRGALFIADGENPPAYVDPLVSIETVEDASILPPPATCTADVVSDTTGTYGNVWYCVTATTGRGETIASPTGFIASGVRTGFSSTNYNTVSWEPVAGCLGYKVYFNVTGATVWRCHAEVASTVTSFDDTEGVAIVGGDVEPSSVSTAYNTPAAWNVTDGYPEGFHTIPVGDGERLCAWRGNTVWVSAVADGLDWFSPNDAFAFSINSSGNNNITGMATLFDYTVVFTSVAAYVYTGTDASAWGLSKVLPIGCVSHKSIVHAGPDVWFWSQYGPASLSRILQGVDISITIQSNERVNPIIFNEIDQTMLDQISGVNDPKNRRIIWSVFKDGVQADALVYQYDLPPAGAWVEYDGFYFRDAICDKHLVIRGCGGYYAELNEVGGDQVRTYDYDYRMPCKLVASSTENNYLYRDNINITPIVINTGSFEYGYHTAWFDMLSWMPKKRVVFTDVIVNRSLGDYEFNVYWSFDYDRYTSDDVVLTQTTTNGATVQTTSATTTQHRVYMNGIGNAFQLVLWGDSSSGIVEILGWRPNANFKGYR